MTFFDARPPRRASATAACRLLATIAVCSVAALGNAAYAQELMTAKSLPDLVAEAEWIGVADLVDAHPRMNARGNLIVTDYHFRQQTSLLGAPPSLDFVLTQGGGTLAGVTDHLSDTADLQTGHAYVIFVLKNEVRDELLAVKLDPKVETAEAGDGVVYWTVPKGDTLNSAMGKAQASGKHKPWLTTRNLNTLEKLTR